MSSKYGFLTRLDIDGLEAAKAASSVRLSEQIERDLAAERLEEQARHERACAELLATTVLLAGERIADILGDYVQAEFGTVASIRTYDAPPDLHLWQFWSDPDLLVEAFLLVQGDPPEAGLFVSIEKRDRETGGLVPSERLPNLDRLMVVLREHAGVITRIGRQVSKLREIIQERTGNAAGLDPRQAPKPPASSDPRRSPAAAPSAAPAIAPARKG